jgi:mannose-6-phosphate isomerase-like protein (cupin superfamily)
MHATASELLARLPGQPTDAWPSGEQFARALTHGSMSVELYAPVGMDTQKPHAQDELYFIHSGSGVLTIADAVHEFGPGACFFVPAGAAHRFDAFSSDFSTWVVFWGPSGGEAHTTNGV